MMQGLRLAVLDIVLGLACAIALSRFVTSLLFGVEPLDTTTLAVAIPAIAAVAALACWIPAWRAARLDPNLVLRAD
ncbi:MAG TPA: hypothetical protein VIL35_15105 [Vicinamibacterales bacterium]